MNKPISAKPFSVPFMFGCFRSTLPQNCRLFMPFPEFDAFSWIYLSLLYGSCSICTLSFLPIQIFWSFFFPFPDSALAWKLMRQHVSQYLRWSSCTYPGLSGRAALIQSSASEGHCCKGNCKELDELNFLWEGILMSFQSP